MGSCTAAYLGEGWGFSSMKTALECEQWTSAG